MSERQRLAERLRRFVGQGGPRKDGGTPRVFDHDDMDPYVEPKDDAEYIRAIHAVVRRNTGLIRTIITTQADQGKRISMLERWKVAWGVAAAIGTGAFMLLIQHLTNIIKIP